MWSTRAARKITSDLSDPYPVLQAALNQSFWNDPSSGNGPGDIYVQAGDYALAPTFPGFDVYSYTRLTMDPTARIAVPSGYVGYAFGLHSADNAYVAHTIIDGGQAVEQAPAQQQWTAFLLQASANTNTGILFNKLMNTIVYDAQIGVRLWVDGQREPCALCPARTSPVPARDGHTVHAGRDEEKGG